MITNGEFIRNATQITISEEDSTEEVIRKLNINFSKLHADFKIFDDDMNIVQGCQGDVWAMLKKFIGNQIWWTNLIDTAKTTSRKQELKGNRKKTDREIIENWITIMWEDHTSQGVIRKLNKLFRTKISAGTEDVTEQFHEIFQQVKEIMGANTEFQLPTKGESGQPSELATVNLTYLLTALKLVEQWDHEDDSFWNHVQQTEMEKILFPYSFSDKTTWARSMTDSLQQLKEKLQSKEPTSKTDNTGKRKKNII